MTGIHRPTVRFPFSGIWDFIQGTPFHLQVFKSMKCFNIRYRNSHDLSALLEAANNHPKDQILIQVFTGQTEENVLRQLQADLVQALPGVAILGVTAETGILKSAILEKETIVSLSLFSCTKVKTHFVIDRDNTLDGQQLGREIGATGAKLAILFTTGTQDGQIRNNGRFVQALCAAAHGVTFCGGQAGISSGLDDTYVFTETTLTMAGAVAASLCGADLQFWNFRSDGWKPVGRKMEITEVSGLCVKSIDNLSVKRVYELYLGVNIDIATPQNPTLDFPLLYQSGGLLRKNVPVREHPDGGFEYLMRFRKGDRVRFSYCDISMLETEAMKIKTKLVRAAPEAIFIYSCSARKRVFGGEISIDNKGFENISTVSGFFTSTEFFTTPNGKLHCLLQNMTLLALSEKEGSSGLSAQKPVRTYEISNQRVTKVLKMLTRLISVTTSELEESNRKLAEMAHIDTLTGLYNRRYFDQRLTEELRKGSRSSAAFLSLLMLDVDYFKQYNDTYGHTAGDECLTVLGRILKKSLKRSTDIAFRYGGEEMGCLLPTTDFIGAQAIAQTINEHIAAAGMPHKASRVAPHITASIGFITLHFCKDYLPDIRALINLCDELLYQAKANGRNQAIGHEISGTDPRLRAIGSDT